MKINTIWEELEKDTSFKIGLLYKRYSSNIKPDIFVALRAPENLRCIAFRINSALSIGAEQLNNLRDIKLETLPDESGIDNAFLLILLLNRQHKDIFSTLCEDLIYTVSEIGNEISLIETLIARLLKWQSLFEELGQQGLSPGAQSGLFGELYFLRKYLAKSSDYIQCLKAWTGPIKAIQDFQFGRWALEVKTTSGKNHQKIYVSSERQLDDSLIPAIFLYHLSLDIRNGNGETLNALIDSIYDLLSNISVASNLFRFKLMEAGYFEIHRAFYDENGYTIRQENIYSVSGEFPRITERQIPKGVGDVQYSIILAESESWRIAEDELFLRIGE